MSDNRHYQVQVICPGCHQTRYVRSDWYAKHGTNDGINRFAKCRSCSQEQKG